MIKSQLFNGLESLGCDLQKCFLALTEPGRLEGLELLNCPSSPSKKALVCSFPKSAQLCYGEYSECTLKCFLFPSPWPNRRSFPSPLSLELEHGGVPGGKIHENVAKIRPPGVFNSQASPCWASSSPKLPVKSWDQITAPVLSASGKLILAMIFCISLSLQILGCGFICDFVSLMDLKKSWFSVWVFFLWRCEWRFSSSLYITSKMESIAIAFIWF